MHLTRQSPRMTHLGIGRQGALGGGAVASALRADVDVCPAFVNAEDSAHDHVAALEVVVILVKEHGKLLVKALDVHLVHNCDGLLGQGGGKNGRAASGAVAGGADGRTQGGGGLVLLPLLDGGGGANPRPEGGARAGGGHDVGPSDAY